MIWLISGNKLVNSTVSTLPGSDGGARENDQSELTVGFSVLIVEDDAIIGMLLAEMLQDMGYDVCAVAATEEDAVANAERFKPGLMIVDEHLGAGSGRSAVTRIFQNGPIPCVFISGGPVPSGMSGTTVLQKPFLEADLICAVQRVVDMDHAPVAVQSAPPHLVAER